MKNKQTLLAIGLLAVFYLVNWSWVFFTDGVTLADSESIAIPLAIMVAIFNVTISVSIIVIAFKYTTKLFKKYSVYLAIPLAVALFAFADFLVSWLTTIIWIGPQGSLDNVQPLTSPALPFMLTPLRFATRFIGLYGLAAFVWVSIYLLSHKKLRRYIWLPVSILVILSSFGWVIYSKPNGTQQTATIVSETLTEKVPAINNPQSNVVIFPEYGFDDITNEILDKRLESSEKVNFVASKQINVKDMKFGHRNVLLFGNSQDGITKEQDKHRLIPGGEDLSYIGIAFLKLTKQEGTMQYFLTSRSVNKGKTELQPFVIDNNTKVGAAVCSSIISTRDYRKLTKDGASILTNSASLDIFLGSPVFKWQQKTLAKFMAVSNNRYFLQSANSATAYAIDNNGKQIAETVGISTKDVKFINNSQKTFYTNVGEWLTVAGAITLIYIIVIDHKSYTKLNQRRKRK